MTRGPDKGYCVICGEYSKLTRDHVPPKGCNNNRDMVLKTYVDCYEKNSNEKRTISQGGTHYKTLCKSCNTYLLGAKYDPELVKLSKSITHAALITDARKIILPHDSLEFIRPQKIARAVIGHLLAANAIDESKNGLKFAPFPDALRYYFLNENEPLPKKLDIYFWFYPYKKQVIIKGAGKLYYQGSKEIVLGHILKFLPLGFWIVWDKPCTFYENLITLVPNKGMGIEELHQTRIDFRSIQKSNFPEGVNDSEVLLLDEESSIIGTLASEHIKYVSGNDKQ